MTMRELYDQVGGNYDDLLRRIPKEEAIQKFVKKFAANEEIYRMTEAFAAEDYKSVFEISHNLKGMSANLSFTKIHETTAEICEAVRNGAPSYDISGLVVEAGKLWEELKAAMAEAE